MGLLALPLAGQTQPAGRVHRLGLIAIHGRADWQQLNSAGSEPQLPPPIRLRAERVIE